MVTTKKTPVISEFLNSNKYPSQDLTKLDKEVMRQAKQKLRSKRSDLSFGDVVVILEGRLSGKKAVYMKDVRDYHTVVSGVNELNGFGLVQIDEMHLLKLNMPSVILENTILEKIDEKHLSVLGVNLKEDILKESNSEMKAIESQVKTGLSKVKFMTSYFVEDFKVDNSKDFYSINH